MALEERLFCRLKKKNAVSWDTFQPLDLLKPDVVCHSRRVQTSLFKEVEVLCKKEQAWEQEACYFFLHEISAAMESLPCFLVLWWSWPAFLSLSLTWELVPVWWTDPAERLAFLWLYFLAGSAPWLVHCSAARTVDGAREWSSSIQLGCW